MATSRLNIKRIRLISRSIRLRVGRKRFRSAGVPAESPGAVWARASVSGSWPERSVPPPASSESMTGVSIAAARCPVKSPVRTAESVGGACGVSVCNVSVREVSVCDVFAADVAADISGDDMPVSGVPACCGTAAAGTGCSWRPSCCLRGVDAAADADADESAVTVSSIRSGYIRVFIVSAGLEIECDA